jgi:hypothetical protein
MTFDNGYDKGDVVRLFFGHADPGDPQDVARPFALQDLVVVSDVDDQVFGHAASVSDKTRGAIADDPDDDPTHTVRVRNKTKTVRKSAVVMKRRFGTVDDSDVTISKDPTGTWSGGGDE